jgi:hypothetical protein
MLKHTITTCLFLLAASQNTTQAQSAVSNIWASIDQDDFSTISTGDKLSSSNTEIQGYINRYSISKIEQALPSSKQEALLKVYTISCACSAEVLIADINRTNSVIKKAENAPNYSPLFTPNDYNLAFQNDYALDLINAEEAWNETTGDSSVVIAISDSNFDLNHEELVGTVIAQDMTFSNSNSYHGTAVAITAAGNTDNQQGKSSIGANCSLQLRNMNFNAILDATYSNAQVINVSWTSGCSYNNYEQMVIDEAYNNGSIIVAAAGNGSTCADASNYVYPAALAHVIAVSSVGPQNNHERTIGDPTTTHQHNDKVDVLAPGYDVALTVASGWYLTGNGTSFAAPYVSGLVGLIKSVNPCLSFEEVEFILKNTAYNVDTINPEYAGKLGAGTIDAAAAVTAAINFENQPDYDITSTILCSTGETLAKVINYDTTAIVSIVWSNGQDAPSMIFNESGTYSMTITDTLGCLVTEEIDITVSPILGAQIKTTELDCFESNIGSINAAAFGGLAPYTFFWNNSSSAASLDNLGAGIYSLTILDANNCTHHMQVELISPEEIIIEATVYSDDYGNGGGAIEIDVFGGTGDLTYNWSNGSNLEDLSSLSIGNYTLIVEDENQCQNEMSFVVSGAAASTEGIALSTIELFPNPAIEKTVTISGKFTGYKVYNAVGQLIMNETNQHQIDISAFRSGIYEVVIQTSAGPISKKLSVL